MKKGKTYLSIFLSLMLFASICMPTGVFSEENNAGAQENIEVDITGLEAQLTEQLGQALNSGEVTEAMETALSKQALPEEILKDPKAYQAWKNDYLSGEANSTMGIQALAANYLSNEYVAAQVNYGGRFNIGTTGGNPDNTQDDNKYLLYAWPYGRTSYTTVQIDSVNYLFNTQNLTANEDGTQLISTMIFDQYGIIVKQILSLEMNTNTGRDDMVKINYEVTNIGSANHEVGIRIMMDTMLGYNDGAPFRISGYGNITTETEMTGAYVPQYWQAFDKLDNPTIVASGMLYNTFNERPDKIQFAAWPWIYGTGWDYQVEPGYDITNDSAVALYYNPRTFAPGATNNFATYYGIGDFRTMEDPEDLLIGVTAPQIMIPNPDISNYYSNPYTITCYLKNNTPNIITNAAATLVLPESNELTLPSQGSKVINIGDLAPGEEKVIAYSVLAKSQTEDKTLDYHIDITSDNYETKNALLSITLPKITSNENGSISLNKTSISLMAGQTDLLQATLTGISGAVTWSSNKPHIAKVNSYGVITGMSAGTATITASAGGKTATCTVAVSGSYYALNGISISPSTATIGLNQTVTLTVNYDPSNASNKQIKSWTSSRPDVASVSGGKVTGKSYGTAVINATSQDGNKQAICTITVKEAEPTLELGDGVDFEQQITGPYLDFGGYHFPLFNIKVGTEVKLGDNVKLVYDPSNDKFVAYFGDMHEKTGTNDKNADGTLTEAAKQLRRDTYREIKGLMGLLGRQTNRDFYNSYRRLISKSSPLSVSGNRTFFGYVEFVYSNGKYVLSGGEVAALFEAGVEVKTNFPPAPVVYLKFGINGSLQAGLRIKLHTSGVLSSGVDVYGKIETKFVPFVGVGGNLLVAEVEGGLEGTVKSIIQLPLDNSSFTPQRDLELTLSADVYLKYKVFVFINGKHTYPLGSYRVYPPQNTAAQCLATINSESLELMPRDYINSTSFTANGSSKGLNAMAAADFKGNYSPANIMTNTYPYGEPQLIKLNDTEYLLVFIGDVESRSAENRTGLYYSIFNGTSWSVPALVDDDGTADFSPRLINSEGNTYLAWQNIESVLGEGATPEDFSRNSGIAAAKFNGLSFDASKMLSAPDNMLDNAPVISAGNGQVSVAWVKNSANDVFNSTGTSSIYRSTLSNGNWSQAASVVADAGFIGELTSAYNGSNNIIVYAKDTDNNLETIIDRELFMVKGRGLPTAITKNDVMDSNPVLATIGGVSSLYWSSDEGTYFSESIDNIVPVRIGASVDGVFKVIAGEYGRAIIWEKSMGYSSELYGMFYDKGQWGAPVQITDNGTRIREVSGVWGADGALHLAYMSAAINAAADNANGDPTGATDLVVAELVPSCDLAFGTNVSYDKMQILPNGVVTFGAYIENLGQQSVPGFYAVLSDENGVLSKTLIETPLSSGTGAYIDVPYALPDAITMHQLTLSIEALGLDDYNLSNNTAAFTIGDAVIDVNSPIISGMGSRRTVTAAVNNTGYAASGPLTVNLYANSTDTAPISTQTVASIPAQLSRIVEFTLPITSESFNNGDFLVYVGVNDGIYESFVSTVVRKPEQSSSLTISSAAQVGNIVLFNIDNNSNTAVDGTILISSRDNYDNQLSQSLSIAGLDSQSVQLDITSLQEDGALSIRVLGDNGEVISNIVNIYSNGEVQLESPIAIPAGGNYTSSVLVTLYSEDSDAKIYYTVDGSIPSRTNGIEYKEAFVITRTTTVNFIAVKEGMVDSEVASALYRISIKPSYVSIEPGTINLKNIEKGNGKITVYVAFPENLSPYDVSLETIRVNDVMLPVSDPKYGYVKNPIADYNGDGILEFMFKIEAEQLKGRLVPGDNDIAITGEIGDYQFYWNGTLNVIQPPNDKK